MGGGTFDYSVTPDPFSLVMNCESEWDQWSNEIDQKTKHLIIVSLQVLLFENTIQIQNFEFFP